ncbi:MAG: hypothetical protein QME52_01825 [Bacteroidota bacterium]|nr:hypothetical protein [Bacteroidota bacterium]
MAKNKRPTVKQISEKLKRFGYRKVDQKEKPETTVSPTRYTQNAHIKLVAKDSTTAYTRRRKGSKKSP